MRPLHSKSRLHRLLVAARSGTFSAARRAANDTLAAPPRLVEPAPYEWPAVLDGARQALFVHDSEQRILRCNAAYAAKAGASLAAIVGKPYWQVLPKLDAPPAPCRNDAGCDKTFSLRGGEQILLDRNVVAYRSSGEFWYCCHLLEDISARERLEHDLAREKKILDDIIDSAPSLFFLVDQEGRLVRWNQYLRQKTGFSDDKLRGRPATTLVQEEDRTLVSAKFLSALATGYARMEVRPADKAPTSTYFLTTVRRLLIDDVPHLAGFCVDIGDRKRAEKALAEQKSFLDALVENIPGVFCVVDREGNYLRWNSNLNRLTGLTDEELYKSSSLLTVAEPDREEAAHKLSEAFDKGYVKSILNVVSKDRGTRPFLMTGRRFEVDATAYLVGVGIDATDQMETIHALQQEAHTDSLTQVPNRAHFLERAMHEFARGRRYGHPLSIAMLDLDHFKNVNDTYGHQAGDSVLRAFAATGREALRDWDIMGRLGGEEFAVLLPETDAEQTLLVAERLRQAVASSAVPLGDGVAVSITVSIGITTMRAEDADVHALLARADSALYAAKTTGRDKVKAA